MLDELLEFELSIKRRELRFVELLVHLELL